jgi:hypothetical protein
MKKLILSLGIFSLILCSACEKEEPLSAEAEATKLLITRDINAIEDLMHFKVLNSDLESIFQAWNSNEEEGTTFLDLELRDRKIVATHRLLDIERDEWSDSTIHIFYEAIENYLIQTNQLIDAASGKTLREGNNIVIYLKAESE